MGLYILIALALVGITGSVDPAPSLVRSKAASRQLDCARLDVESGSQAHPGQIAPARPRGDFSDRTAMVCQERLVRPGLRGAQDEAILRELGDQTATLAGAAAASRPDLAERTWLVETHYADSDVAHKIAFATKNALVEQGLAVSDRAPTLGAGDVGVLTRLPPTEAYPAACRRYSDNGSLKPDDALLAVIRLDHRETLLHAGVCDGGSWTWLQ